MRNEKWEKEEEKEELEELAQVSSGGNMPPIQTSCPLPAKHHIYATIYELKMQPSMPGPSVVRYTP